MEIIANHLEESNTFLVHHTRREDDRAASWICGQAEEAWCTSRAHNKAYQDAYAGDRKSPIQQ